jgi:nucleoside-diphosphate-sugar epimerase
MTDTIAITGATGFVGSMLMRQLSSTGRQIQALIRPVSTHKRQTDITAKWVEGDLDDIDSLRRLVRGANTIVHCAGAVRGSSKAQFNRINVDGVARLVQAATEQSPAPHFVLISSLAAREPHLSPYAASKRQGEKVLSGISGKLPWTVFRPTAVYGPGDRELLPVFRWIERGIAPILGSGNGRFSMIFVKDLADAVLKSLENGECHEETFELHDGHPGGYSWYDVIEAVKQLRAKPVVRLNIPLGLAKALSTLNLILAQIVGYAPMLTPGKVRELQHANWVCDNTALSKATGWTPQILLPEGLRRTLGCNGT